MKNNLEERVKALVGENQTIKKDVPLKVDGRKNNKGALGKAGRKPKEANLVAKGIKKYLDDHISSTIDIEVVNPNTGKAIKVQTPRLVLVLEKLYEIGMKGDGDADALNKWLDRALGKPKQVLAGDEENPPFKLQINIANILDKAYGSNDSGNREVHNEG